MSKKAQKVYRKAVARHLKPYHANWLPGDPRQLGDYGVLDNGIFIPKGNIRNLGISFDTIEDPNLDQHTFLAGKDVNLEFNAAGTVPGVANASAKVKMKNAWSVFFHAIGGNSSRVKNKVELEAQILDFYRNNRDRWKRRYVVVTDLIEAGRTIVAVSSSSNAEIIVEAKGEADIFIDLQDSSIEIKLGSSSNVGYQIIGDSGMDVLLGFSRIHRKDLRPASEVMPSTIGHNRLLRRVKDDEDLFPTEPEDLYFGQFIADLNDDFDAEF